jgi:hypothetical protein
MKVSPFLSICGFPKVALRKEMRMPEERDEFLGRVNKSVGVVEEVIEKIMADTISVKEASERTEACTTTLKQLNLELRARRDSAEQVNELPLP